MWLLRLIQLVMILVVCVDVNSTDNDENNTKRNNENNNQQSQRSTSNKQVLSIQDREAEGRHIAKKTLKLGSTERCEWSEPMNIVKGKLCGGEFFDVPNLFSLNQVMLNLCKSCSYDYI